MLWIDEIEKGLTATQEVNVNLQVLLERAVNNQRESDVHATRAMRHIHTNLATVSKERDGMYHYAKAQILTHTRPLFAGCL